MGISRNFAFFCRILSQKTPGPHRYWVSNRISRTTCRNFEEGFSLYHLLRHAFSGTNPSTAFAQLVEWWQGLAARHNSRARFGRMPYTVCLLCTNTTDLSAPEGTLARPGPTYHSQPNSLCSHEILVVRQLDANISTQKTRGK